MVVVVLVVVLVALTEEESAACSAAGNATLGRVSAYYISTDLQHEGA